MRIRRNRPTRREREKFTCDRSGKVGREGDFIQDRGISVIRLYNIKDRISEIDKDAIIGQPVTWTQAYEDAMAQPH